MNKIKEEVHELKEALNQKLDRILDVHHHHKEGKPPLSLLPDWRRHRDIGRLDFQVI